MPCRSRYSSFCNRFYFSTETRLHPIVRHVGDLEDLIENGKCSLTDAQFSSRNVVDPGFEGRVEKLVPLVAHVEDEAAAEEEVLQAEA